MEIVKIQIPKIIDIYPSTENIKKFASIYTKIQWNELCNNREFLNLIMEQTIEKSKSLADSILGIKEEKIKKNGDDDSKELINAS